MSEKATANKLRDTIFNWDGWHAIRVENSAYPGTPDIQWCFGLATGNPIDGWIELKKIKKLPKRADTIVRCEHYTNEQIIWHTKRRMVGGRVHLLVQIKRAWYLYDAGDATLFFGQVPLHVLQARAIKVWPNGIVREELWNLLLKTGAGEWTRREARERLGIAEPAAPAVTEGI